MLKIFAVFIFSFLGLAISQAQEVPVDVDGGIEAVVSDIVTEFPAITETETNIYITVNGEKVNSVTDVRNLIAQALKKPAITGNRQVALQSLIELLGNPANTPKKVDITITSGGVLEDKIGKRGLRELLDALTQTEQLNKDEFGITNLSILFWQ